MGIGNAAVEILIGLRTAGYLKPGDAVAEIGAQQLSSSFLSVPERVAHLGGLFGTDQSLPLPPPPEPESEPDWALLTAPFARDFWRWLGFKYATIDVDGSPDSIPLDLNYDGVPAEAVGQYNLVTNFGTTEHVANQLNAFKIIHDLTAPEGIMLHEVPAQGMFNHGLVSYNFKFFWLLMRSNGYKFIHADFMPAEQPADFPDNIEEYLNSSKLATERQPHDYRAVDAGWLVVMQKSFDMPFIPPVDVNSGITTEDENLKERYWTVFDPDRFDQWQANAAKAHAARGREKSNVRPSETSSPRDAPTMGVNSSPSLQSAAKYDSWRFGNMLRPWRLIRRLVRNSDATVQVVEGISNQSDLLERKMEAIIQGIGNQSDLIRRKLDALNRVMHELREIQKAQLAMQRQAAEAIRQYSAVPHDQAKIDKSAEPV